MRFRRNADEPARRRERAAMSDPAMINAVVADKLRAGRAGEITLGELAMLTDMDLQRALPPGLVRACVRSITAPRKGFFYGGPVYQGMIDSMLQGGARIATPEIMQEMISLFDAEQIIVDVLAPQWLLFHPSRITDEDGEPTLHLVVPHGWLDEEVRTNLGGDPQHAVAIHVEGSAHPHLAGNWICFMDLDLEDV